MRKNCGGPAMAAAAQGTTLFSNGRRNKNGNTANRAKKIKYHASTRLSGWLGFAGSKRLKCQAHSSAATHARPIAGIQSRENNFVTPNSSTTSNKARPNTGEGLINGSRKVAMMSSRNGSTMENAGRMAARSPGAVRSSPNLIPAFKAPGLNFLTSQMPAPTKKTTKAPSRKKEVGRPVRSAGILNMSAPVAASVSSSTASTGSSVAVSAASPMASKSTSNMNGQTMNETSASLKTGTSTSASARIGKR